MMSILFSISFAASSYESGKIDTHGGKKTYMYDKKNYQSPSMGISNFLDTNTSKKPKEDK